ncbi:LOW QUALITY PROTEIN: NADPH-dependent pterin aldehyde reductase [Lactuca sativa]|uniref:LOW QUALITY PROTEIN: NADPH-dependent pterin aldehyde reductase n=1 Tax=Lactuca sativa TaxID=4236 RepID=UPI001C691700|nr:LOW QUALITY PROTEIN: NADPH-dependent pterin aldehyde reductase [Lactuca sativa]
MEKKGVTDIIGNEILKSSIAIVPIEFRLPSLANRSVFAINNAGTINKNNRLWEVPEEEFNVVIDTNLKGIANMLCHFIALMIEKKQGILVNMLSGWGRSAAAHVAPYCASKWAVEGLTKSVAKELPAGMEIVAFNSGVKNSMLLYLALVAPKAADMILNLIVADNGAFLSV